MRNLPKYYWDSSTFLIVLNKEECHGLDVLESAREILKRTYEQTAVIISSVIIVSEILPSRTTIHAYERFEAWLQWPNLHLRGVDHPVAIRAAELRDKCLQGKPHEVRIDTADALHVATALLYENEICEIHSVDKDFKKAMRYSGSTLQVVPPRIELSPKEKADRLQIRMDIIDPVKEAKIND